MSPVGDTAAAFLVKATAAGWPLRRGSGLSWLTNRGHANVRLADALKPSSLDFLREIFLALDGDETELAGIGERTLAAVGENFDDPSVGLQSDPHHDGLRPM